ncbi:hypothetical protein VTO73DRAFT_4650 [Trametes versicolor]
MVKIIGPSPHISTARMSPVALRMYSDRFLLRSGNLAAFLSSASAIGSSLRAATVSSQKWRRLNSPEKDERRLTRGHRVLST